MWRARPAAAAAAAAAAVAAVAATTAAVGWSWGRGYHAAYGANVPVLACEGATRPSSFESSSSSSSGSSSSSSRSPVSIDHERIAIDPLHGRTSAHLRPVMVAVLVRHGARTPITRGMGVDRNEFQRLWGQCHSPDAADAVDRRDHPQQQQPDNNNDNSNDNTRTTFTLRSRHTHADEEHLRPCGHGQLTQLGELQLYTIGQRLRDMYVLHDGLLSERFVPRELFMRSTDTDRTRLSLIRLVQGLYHPQPPSMRTIKRHLHVADESREILAPNFRHCDRMREVFVQSLYHPFFLHYMTQPRVAEIASHTMLDAVRARLPVSHESWVPVPSATSANGDGDSTTPTPIIPSPRIFIGIGDEIKCRLAEGLPMPAWLTADDARDANAVGEFLFHTIFHAGHYISPHKSSAGSDAAASSSSSSLSSPSLSSVPPPLRDAEAEHVAVERREEMLRLSMGSWFSELLQRMDDTIRYDSTQSSSAANAAAALPSSSSSLAPEDDAVSYLEPLSTPHHSVRSGASPAPPSMLVYAAHDSSVLPALECLGVVDVPTSDSSSSSSAARAEGRIGKRNVSGQWPPFACNLVFELLAPSEPSESSDRDRDPSSSSATAAAAAAAYHVRVLYNFEPVLSLPYPRFRARLDPFVLSTSSSSASTSSAAPSHLVHPSCARRDPQLHIPAQVF